MNNKHSAEAAAKYADGLWPLVTWLVGRLHDVDPSSLARIMERPDLRALWREWVLWHPAVSPDGKHVYPYVLGALSPANRRRRAGCRHAG